MDQYQDKVSDILTNVEKYHEAYYLAETFRGPSLYFHHRSLATRNLEDIVKHLEYVYATLASWGMHRMGRGGSKMQSFETFRKSIEPLRGKITEAQKIDFKRMHETDWSILNEIFLGIKIMASGTSLVGNSKVMHHMMPNIVPPIDREYTLRYLRGNTNIANDLDHEWGIMKGFISDFFVPVARDQKFISKAYTWISNQERYPWDTSIFKVVDNLVIGAKK